MKDSTLIKISLVWSFVGIVLLIVAAIFAKPEVIKLSYLEENIGKTIVVQGTVGKTSYQEKASFIELKDERNTIEVVMFENPETKVYMGDLVSIKGKVQIYKNKISMVAEGIYCIECE